MDDKELTALQKKAIETMKLAVGKIDFMAQQGVINPFAIIQARMEDLVEWLIPSNLEGDEPMTVKGGPAGMIRVPTNPERLRFDIYCNEKTIERLDEAVSQQASGLHVVKGLGDNGLRDT